MEFMELPRTPEDRIQCIRNAAAKVGGNAALGRALGYRDGAFVGQMLRGERPVTEKTLLAMRAIRQLADLFTRPDQSQRPIQLRPAQPSIGDTLNRLGTALSTVPAERREAVAGMLSAWAKEGGAAMYLPMLETLLATPQTSPADALDKRVA
jgi:hypothetical protein